MLPIHRLLFFSTFPHLNDILKVVRSVAYGPHTLLSGEIFVMSRRPSIRCEIRKMRCFSQILPDGISIQNNLQLIRFVWVNVWDGYMELNDWTLV